MPDLQNIKKYLPENRENSIVIAAHGLEFWTAWALNVKVVQDRAMDKIGLDRYNNVLFLKQQNEVRQDPLGRRPVKKPGFGKGRPPQMEPGKGTFNDPPMSRPIPENFKLVYSSAYFKVYQKLK